MALNTRFATGVYALVLLAEEPDAVQTSEEIATQLNTNPVVIRRVFSLLRSAGILRSQKGPSGGSKLARPPRQITLADIYRALEPGSLHHDSPTQPAMRRVSSALQDALRSARTSMEERLEETTLAQLARQLRRSRRLA